METESIKRSVDSAVVAEDGGDLVVTGWALLTDGPRARVGIRADGKLLGHVRADRERVDLAEIFPDLDHAGRSGFRFRVPASVAQGLRDLEVVLDRQDGGLTPIWALRLAPAEITTEETAERSRPRRRRAKRLGIARAAAAAGAAPDGEAELAPAAGARELPAEVEAEDPFRVVAIMSAFNEADVIELVIEHLASNGILVYLIDDGSTDDTVAQAQRWIGRGLLGVEAIAKPADAKTSWRAILARKLELARELGADWYIHHDADEFRESPFPGTSIAEAIRWVDRRGYNAIDFRVLNFPPVDDTFRPGDDPRAHFRRWEDPAEYDVLQRKCWKAGFADVSLEDGGHDVRFPGRRLFPIRFLLRHYPVRSQAHGARKVMHERKHRFVADEIAYGWHRQYEAVASPDHLFLRNPASLRTFDLDALRLEAMLETNGESREPRDSGADVPTERPGARGFLEQVSPTAIAGWAACAEAGDSQVEVELWDGGRLFATVPAERSRPDLPDDISGGGFHIRTPRELLDGRPHWIWATVRGTHTALWRTPLVLQSGGRISIGSDSTGAETAEVA